MPPRTAFVVRFGNLLFRYRSYIPIPLFLLVVVFARFDALYLVAGIILVLLGETLRFIGVGYAGSATRTTEVGADTLVVAGPFAQMRNPLYVGNIMLGVGLAVGGGGLMPWLPLGYLIFISLYYYFIVRAEEDFLRRKFGAQYEAYYAAVPRFFPRLTPWQGRSGHRMSAGIALRSERRTFQTIIIMAVALALAMIAKVHWLHWDF